MAVLHVGQTDLFSVTIGDWEGPFQLLDVTEGIEPGDTEIVMVAVVGFSSEDTSGPVAFGITESASWESGGQGSFVLGGGRVIATAAWAREYFDGAPRPTIVPLDDEGAPYEPVTGSSYRGAVGFSAAFRPGFGIGTAGTPNYQSGLSTPNAHIYDPLTGSLADDGAVVAYVFAPDADGNAGEELRAFAGGSGGFTSAGTYNPGADELGASGLATRNLAPGDFDLVGFMSGPQWQRSNAVATSLPAVSGMFTLQGTFPPPPSTGGFGFGLSLGARGRGLRLG